ncbi:TPA: hypothetical protein SK934_002173, partial [Staphylococcus aureus]|nr:hypothetical protein [Staphylococcus aureus]HEI9500242.1 hypothetical protein [Staphylococcus aureus]
KRTVIWPFYFYTIIRTLSFLIKQTDFYIITYAGIELLKKYGLEKITLSNILYEFKSNGLHQQKNFDGNK